MTSSPTTLYAIADGKRARILSRDGQHLTTTEDFDAQGHGDTHHDADRAVSHIHSPGSDPHEQSKHHFAAHVAKHLNEAVQGGVRHIHLAAPAHVMHDIVEALSKPAEAALETRLVKDLMHESNDRLLSHFAA